LLSERVPDLDISRIRHSHQIPLKSTDILNHWVGQHEFQRKPVDWVGFLHHWFLESIKGRTEPTGFHWHRGTGAAISQCRPMPINRLLATSNNLRGGSNRLIGSGWHWLMAAPTAGHWCNGAVF
jgi:hypothetical protein